MELNFVPVIESGTFKSTVVHPEAGWANDMQIGVRGRAEAGYVPGIRRNLRFEKRNVHWTDSMLVRKRQKRECIFSPAIFINFDSRFNQLAWAGCCVTITVCSFRFNSRSKYFVLFRLKTPIFALMAALAISSFAFGQEPAKADAKKPEPTPTPVATPVPLSAAAAKEAAKNPTAEQIAETAIFLYGFGGGRAILNQIRKTALERGRINVINAEGKMEQAAYQKWTTRGDTLAKEKIRFDQEFSSARYSLVYSDEKTFGIFNDSVFTPRDDAARAFQNQIFFGLESLLRYKENGSTLMLVGKDKLGGVDFHVIDVMDKQNRKIRYYISAKTFRVMMLEYEDGGVKYRRKYYDYNAAQGTLVPFRSVLYADGKIVEETDIGTVTYGQKIDDNLYSAN